MNSEASPETCDLPDIDPLGRMWSEIKQFLGKGRTRTQEVLLTPVILTHNHDARADER